MFERQFQAQDLYWNFQDECCFWKTFGILIASHSSLRNFLDNVKENIINADRVTISRIMRRHHQDFCENQDHPFTIAIGNGQCICTGPNCLWFILVMLQEGGGGWQSPCGPGLCGLFAQPGSEIWDGGEI